jgi:hypothetical protein
MFWLMKWIRARMGYDKYSSETIDRLAYSMHVEDLRWVASVTTFGAIILIITTISMYDKIPGNLGSLQIGAILAGFCGIIAWCYQTGSARLGFVDLFACEVATLCRICTINGLVDTCINAYEVDTEHSQHDPKAVKAIRERFTHFDSAEAYTPVFDGNAKELRSLKVKVVTNITAFYTYWKATRDAFRKLAKTPQIAADTSSNLEDDPWHRGMRNVIYMQFLTYESARKAIRDLIEFEPNKAENAITILVSELPSYRFLLKHFPPHDVRRQRLELRLDRYRTVMPRIYYEVADARHGDKSAGRPTHKVRPEAQAELSRDWDKAYKMLDELKRHYEFAIGPFPSKDAVTRLNLVLGEELPHGLAITETLATTPP